MKTCMVLMLPLVATATFAHSGQDELQLASLSSALDIAQAAPASNGGGSQPGPLIVSTLDADGDDTIDAKETKNAPAVLRKLDENKDSSVSRDEAFGGGMPAQQGGQQRPVPMLFTALDANGDGKLDKAEMDSAPAALKKLDNNGDGKLATDEFRRRRGGPGADQPVNTNAAPVVASSDTNSAVNPLLFDPKALVKPITEMDGILSDGSHARVYKIVLHSTPSGHPMGPWAPATIKDKGGYWEDTVDKKLYRVDVGYLKILNSRGWDMFDGDGTVHRTRNREEFDKIARQELAGWTFEQAKKDGVVNSVIELQPQDQIVTVFLPKNPKGTPQPTMLRQAHFSPRSGVGVGLDGVRYFPPEPVHRITAFQNIAPLDPYGGHTGFGHEYHYHRAPEVMTNDVSGRIAGYALDGFPIRGPTEADGSKPKNIDAINGHDHDGLGYHYHLSDTWPYIVGGFHGPLGTAALGDANVCDATQQQGGGPPGREGGGRPRAGGGAQGNGPPPRGGQQGKAP